jgi:hypothetical protein
MAACRDAEFVHAHDGEQILPTSDRQRMSQRVGRGMTTKTEYIRESSRLLLAGGDLSVSNPVRIEKQS